MKITKLLLSSLTLAFIPSALFAAGLDLRISQMNAGGTAWNSPVFAPSGATVVTSLPTFKTSLGLGTADSPSFAALTASTGSFTASATGQGLSLHGGGTVTGASGAVTIAASGTNQNVTLTPSGSGYTLLNGNVGIGTTGPSRILEIAHATIPAIGFRNTGQAADQKYWEFSVSGTQFRGMVQNDANSTEAFWLQVLRGAGNAITSVNFPNGDVGIGTTAITSGAKLEVSGTTSATSSVLGTLVVGDLAAATTVGIGGGNINAGGTITAGGAYIESTVGVTGTGATPIALSLVKTTSKITTSATGDQFTLADGVDGQIKRAMLDVLTTGGHTAVITPTTKTGYSTVTLTAAGQSVSFQFVTTRGWIVVGSYGATIAP